MIGKHSCSRGERRKGRDRANKLSETDEREKRVRKEGKAWQGRRGEKRGEGIRQVVMILESLHIILNRKRYSPNR